MWLRLYIVFWRGSMFAGCQLKVKIVEPPDSPKKQTNEFVFWRIWGSKILFRDLLTFSMAEPLVMLQHHHARDATTESHYKFHMPGPCQKPSANNSY